MESSPLDVRSALLGFVAGALVALVGALMVVPSGGSAPVIENAASQTGTSAGPSFFGSVEDTTGGDTSGDIGVGGASGTATTATGGPTGTGGSTGRSTATTSTATGSAATSTGTTGTSGSEQTTSGGSGGEDATATSGGDSTTSGTGSSGSGSSGSGSSGSGSTSGGFTSGSGSTTDTGSTSGSGSTTDTGSTSGSGSTSSGLSCQPGQNGGATAPGVTGSKILLGATVVESGVGAAFLGEARLGMTAVVAKVNRAGGICGRTLDVKYVDDKWDPQAGFEAIKSLVEGEQVFALAVVPSSEGLNTASEAGYFERKKVPVIGSDGMIRTQYTDPYIFPVAASTVSIMHIMAKDAFDGGARDFGLVYEKTYRFGVEGAFAFNAAVKRLTSQNIPGYQDPFGAPTCPNGTHFCAIGANEQDYSSDARNFNAGCFNQDQVTGRERICDFVGLLLEPATGLQWFRTSDTVPAGEQGFGATTRYKHGQGAAQPMFTREFGVGCGDKCNGLELWTGYNPPIEQYATAPGVQAYVNDLKSISSQADEFNQFTEGAYLGMLAVVEGLARTGPDLTRQGLVDTLHAMPALDTGLSSPLTWRPGNHFANPAAQVFAVKSVDGFVGWRLVHGYVQDPWLGQDIG